MLDKPWIYGSPSKKQACYQHLTNCTYCTVLGSYKNCNIIELTPKSTPFEAFYEIYKVVLDRISENTASLVQSDMYVAINKDDTTPNGLYVIQLISEAYTLQNNITIDGHVISDGELVFKAQYLCSMQENTNWYWKKHPLKQTIIFPTQTIIHPTIDVITIRYVQDTPKNVCNSIQEKNPYKDILLL